MKTLKLSDIKPNPNNPRLIKDDKFKKLVESVKSFPEMLELRPIVVNKDMIILWGNMRYKACKEAWIKEIPVIVADNLTEEQEKEFLIKDNVSGWEWDWDILANEWDKEELEEWWLDVQFETVEPEAEEDDFEVDEGLKTDIVLGDLFEIGEHRLLCGDSTNIDDVERLLDWSKSDMVWTDPPYLMDFTWGIHSDGSKSFNSKHWAIKNDKMSDEEWKQFLDDINTIISIYNKGAFYISFYRLGIDKYYESMNRVWLNHKSLIIWSKWNHTLSNSDYMSKYEPIFYGWCAEHNFYGGNNGMDIWEIKRTQKNDLHPTMKPIELCEKIITDWSKKDNIVLDLFWWSGSTMVACHQLNRKCFMSELDPKYVQTIINRMIKLDSTLEIKRNWVHYKSVISE